MWSTKKEDGKVLSACFSASECFVFFFFFGVLSWILVIHKTTGEKTELFFFLSSTSNRSRICFHTYSRNIYSHLSMWDNYLVFLFAAHLITRLRFMHPWKLYGIRLSHIFEIPSTSNEKPGISIKMYFDQKPWISIEILDSSNKKFRNTRFFTPWIWYTRYFERNSLCFKKGVKSRVFIEFYVCPLESASVIATHT